MDPTAQQLANRLNPTATTFNLPTEGTTFRVAGSRDAVYKVVNGQLQTIANMGYIANTDLRMPDGSIVKAGQSYGDPRSGTPIGQYSGAYGSRVYGADIYNQTAGDGAFDTLPEFNMGDIIDPATGQLRTSPTVNTPQPAGTPGTVPVPQGTAPINPAGSPTNPIAGATTPAGTISQVSGAPTASVPAQTYTIQAGDTLSKLAQTYGTTVGALMSLNPQITDANKIYTGQKLNLTAPQTGAPVTGGAKGTDQAPDALTAEANRIAAEVAKLTSPANTGTPATPTTTTGKTETQNIIDTYNQVSTQLGLSSIKQIYDKTLADAKELQDKKNDEALDISNNPWYSEGKRQMELKKLDSKYEMKLNTLSNYAKLYDAQYQEGLATARFLTTGIQDDQQFALTLAEKKQEALDALKASSADFKEVQGGLYNIITGEWVVEPTTTTKPPEAPTVKTINGQDMQWNSSTGKWDAITGTTAPGTVDSTQKSIDQLTFLRSTAQQAMNLSGASGASGISKIGWRY
jgi:LysM repeat protein